jgi:phosphinothricin acetyltransferase
MTDLGALVVRHAEPQDHAAVLDIYNHYILHSHITFDVEPFELSERSAWFALFAKSGRCQLFVGEIASMIVGYACSTPFRPKPAYATSVETTVYVHPEHMGQGIGHRLYQPLLTALEGEDAHRAYAVIALPNAPSIRLHEAVGFHRVALLCEAGRKFDKYWDVSWYERPLHAEPATAY